MLRGSVSPAVKEMDFGHIGKTPGLKQVKQSRFPAVEHHQVGLHRLTQQLQTVVVFAGFFFIYCPDDAAGVFVEAIAFYNEFIEVVFFVCQPFNSEIAGFVNHGVKFTEPLVGENCGLAGGVVGKQFPLEQKIGPGGHRDETVS